jgi:hypothetical protein
MIDPRGMTVFEWTDAMSINLDSPNGAFVPALIDPENPDEWRTWAAEVVRALGSNAPDPAYFADWREWAMRFNNTTNLG